MPNDIKNQTTEKSNSGFVTKAVEIPILDSALRERISENKDSVNPEETGFKGFYNSNKFYFWAFLFGIIVIASLSYLAFKKPAPKVLKEANISVNVDVSKTVASGGEAVYKVTLQNNDSQKLKDLELELSYTDGIAFESSRPDPENLSGTIFKVPDLIPGQNAVVFIKTRVTGNINDSKTLNFKLHYKYNNFNSEFVKNQESTIQLVASDIVIDIQGPTNTNNAQLVIYNIKYKNNSKADIKGARVKLTYPNGFKFGSSSPNPDLGVDTWSIGNLSVNGEGNIVIQGTFDASVISGESKTAVADFLILGDDGQFYIQNSSSFVTAISNLPLLVTQVLDGVEPGSPVKPGDNLNFTVKFQNNGSTVVNGVNIIVNLDSKAVDFSSVRAQGGQINNNSILWNASTLPQLEELAPNESGQLMFSLNINNPGTKDASKNLTVVSNIKIKSNEYDTFFPGSPLSIKISSPSSISKSLTFISGQLPPKIGLNTEYKVRISLINSSNDFSNGVLTAFLPLGPGGFIENSFNQVEANNAQYDPSTGKITWSFGSLPAFSGKFAQPKFLEFQVRLNPSSSQIGQSVVLVKTINFTAKDMFTGQEVKNTLDEIRTNDLGGDDAFGKGIVGQ